MWRQARLTSRVIVAIFFCSLLAADAAKAQDAAALAARLHATADANAIDEAGMLPWHLKMDVQLFDAKGKPTEQGTIEEWWGGPSLRRVTFSLPSYGGTQLRNRDGAFVTKDKTYEPGILDDLLDAVVHPISHEEDIDAAKPELRKQKFGKVELECIMVDQPLKNVAFLPLWLFPTYCLDPGDNKLRVTNELGSLMFLRNRIGVFQGKSVAIDIMGESAEGIETASSHVTALSTMPLSDTDFASEPGMETVAQSATKVGAAVMAGKLISRPDPIYPAGAKQNRIEGTVILHAIIGRDGRTRSLKLVSAPDASLAMSAIAAVRQWTYTPYVLLGAPTEVDTTITVNYTLNYTFGPG